MAASVSITSDYEPVEVDLWGAKYETVDLTRKAFKKLAALEAEINALQYDDEAADTFVEKVGEFCDLKMVAVKGKVKASTHINKKWNSELLTMRQVASFIQRIMNAEGEANRPS